MKKVEELEPQASIEQWEHYEQSAVCMDITAIYDRRIETLMDALAKADTLEEMKILQGEIQGVKWSKNLPKLCIADRKETAKNG